MLSSIGTGLFAWVGHSKNSPIRNTGTPPAESSRSEEREAVSISRHAQERFVASQEAAAALKTFRQQAQQSAQSEARERIEAIKRRIHELKMQLLLHGATGAKGILHELKQLAGELKHAAAMLNDGSGDIAATEPASARPVSASMPSETQLAAKQGSGSDATDVDEASLPQALLRGDAEVSSPELRDKAIAQKEDKKNEDGRLASDAALKPAQTDQQRQEDARSIQAAAQALKSLLAMLKSILISQGRNDRETQEQIDAVTRLTNDSAAFALEIAA